jgi:hypothetical protein
MAKAFRNRLHIDPTGDVPHDAALGCDLRRSNRLAGAIADLRLPAVFSTRTRREHRQSPPGVASAGGVVGVGVSRSSLAGEERAPHRMARRKSPWLMRCWASNRKPECGYPPFVPDPNCPFRVLLPPAHYLDCRNRGSGGTMGRSGKNKPLMAKIGSFTRRGVGSSGALSCGDARAG